MIPISDELKQAVIHEVKPKNVFIDFGYRTIEGFNWYKEEYTPNFGYSTWLAQGSDTPLSGFSMLKPSDNKVDYSKLGEKRYASFSFYLKVTKVREGDKFFIRMSFKRDNGGSSYNMIDTPTYNVSDFTDFQKITIQVTVNGSYPLLYFYETWFCNGSSGALDADFLVNRPQVSFYDNATPDYGNLIFATPINVNEKLREELSPIDNDNIISESFAYRESICSAESLKFGLCESSEIEIDVFDKNYDYTGREMDLSLQFPDIQDKFEWKNFVIAEAKKSYAGDIQKRHIVAYDKLKNLNENAFAWYTQYMWGINTLREETYAPYCFDYERQIFATYWNLAKAFGVDKEENLTINHLGHYTFLGYEVTTTRKLRYVDAGVYNHELWFEGTTLGNGNVGDHDALMVVVNLTQNRKSGTEYATFLQDYDSLGRGVETANVLLEFTVSGMTDTVNYLCDSGDVVIPPENWTSVNILSTSHLSIVGDAEDMADSYDVYTVDFKYLNALDLVNGTQRLPYHSYVWRKPTTENIFKADSSITARDVMRSLMEMCGCFFRLDREGHPQFLYAMEHGLYPSNTLFPADDLFPKKSSELTMPTSYYIKANFEEYRVSNFGGVQVVVNTHDSQGAVVRWEYWGDETSDNAYLIDDNIFLCNSQFEYEPEMVGNVQELLENLWNVLNNMSYTPFTAETIGTPFLESGDRFTLLTKTDGFESFIFERTLKGIQVLKDYYEARGVAKTPRVKNFEWGNTNE